MASIHSRYGLSGVDMGHQATGTVSVFGHKAPDTDTVTGALIYAWELNAINISASAFVLGDLPPEPTYVLKTLGLEAPPLLGKLDATDKVAIVDTNNPDELPEDLEKASIHSIVDHHKLIGGLKTNGPIDVDMRPLCSVTSILYARSKDAGLTPPKEIAGLMLAGILSDSLKFRSVTTTALDREHAQELAKLSGLDVDTFGDAMLDAKADIGHLSADDLVTMDSKIFNIGGKKLRVSVLETTKPAIPLSKRADLCTAMSSRASKDGAADVLLFVVDILNVHATSVACTPSAKKIIERAFKAKVDEDGLALLPGILSRKKQIIPALEAAAAADEL